MASSRLLQNSIALLCAALLLKSFQGVEETNIKPAFNKKLCKNMNLSISLYSNYFQQTFSSTYFQFQHRGCQQTLCISPGQRVPWTVSLFSSVGLSWKEKTN